MWAPLEACRTIENSNYNNGMAGNGADDQNQDESADGDGAQDVPDVMFTSASAPTSFTSGSTETTLDESRATINTRMTTKERI